MAPEKRSAFVNVDELMPQVSLEQAAAYYGVTLPELHRVGSETRTRCFLNCGRTQETGDRVLAIQEGHPAKQWHCHQYGCGKGGNLESIRKAGFLARKLSKNTGFLDFPDRFLVSLCDLLKPGPSSNGRPRGARFKEIAADIRAMAEGLSRPETVAAPQPKVTPPPEPKVNLPLSESANERARALIDLDRKFVVDIAQMPPKASAYFRRRPFFTAEVCRKWRLGYLPRDTGDDKSGGTMRGKVVYPYLSESGEVLTWFGRDPEFEEKHKAWEASDRKEREPEKFHFVKGFHRGIELFVQHRLRAEGVAEKLRAFGLIIVEGPNDVIRLDTLGVPAVALCSNLITREQAAKAARLARDLAGGVVTIFLDCDTEGENGMKQALARLSRKKIWPKFFSQPARDLRVEPFRPLAWSGGYTGWAINAAASGCV